MSLESLDESSISIKGDIRSENAELELTSDLNNLRWAAAGRLPFADVVLIFLDSS